MKKMKTIVLIGLGMEIGAWKVEIMEKQCL